VNSINPLLDVLPVDILEESSDIIRPFQLVIEHISMFENIHHQHGRTPGQMPGLMLIDPLIEKWPFQSWYSTAQPMPRIAPTALKSASQAS